VRKPRNAARPATRTRGAKSSSKVLSLLAYFDASRPAATMGTLSRAINAPKSTAYRYVSLLREFGFVMEIEGGRYALGPRALGMARAAQAAIDYAGVARPVMERLSAETGETVFLLRRVSDHAICIGREDPPNPVRFFLELGTAVPLHEGASPKLLLAHLAPRERDAYLARHRSKKLLAGLARIAKAGLAITTDEITPGVWACAGPIRLDDKVIAAISVAGLAFRIDRARRVVFESLVRSAASEISAAIAERQWPMPRRLTV
jgi:DNA-binding IclR family transcriptional regulator